VPRPTALHHQYGLPVISTVLADSYWLVRPGLLVTTAVLALVGGWLLRRGRAGRRALTVLAAVSVVAALALTLTPDTATRAPQFCAIQASILAGHVDWPNVMLLQPAALFKALRTRRYLPVLAATAGVSAVIEATQGALPLGRSCDTDDLVANTLGAGIGVLLAALIVLLHTRSLRRDERPGRIESVRGREAPSKR